MINIFILPTCPYCHKVLDFMDAKGIAYNKIDITNPEKEEVLIKIGGKRQVPFIIDKEHNVEMYESDNIIEYLKTL